MSENFIFQSILLDHCWVCGKRFTNSCPPGLANREDHHIIPRAYVGTDGPQVSLCDGCHTKVHKIQNCLLSKKPYYEFVKGFDSQNVRKLVYLGTCAANAYLATKKDPNKKTLITFSIGGDRVKKLEALKKAIPNLNSRASIYNYALDLLYTKYFGNLR